MSSSSSHIALSGAPELLRLDSAPSYARPRTAAIQYLRALAATSVLLHHSSLVDERFGVYGVSVFFAISGYLMSDLIRSSDPWRFLSHRVLRIYPMFFVVIGFTFVLNRIVARPFTFDEWAVTLAPLGLRSYSLGGVEWTLVYELTYYTALFLVACAKLQRFLELIAVAWVLMILGAVLLLPPLDGPYLPAHLLFLAPPNLAFAGGLLLPYLLSRGYLPRASALLVVPVVLAYDFVDLGTNRLLSGLAAMCLVAWAVQAKAPPGRSTSSALLLLGEWSYALYLCHVPVIQAVFQLWPAQLEALNPAWFGVAAAFVAVLVLGPLDVTLYRKMRSLADAASPLAIRITVCAFVAAFLALTIYGSATHISDQWHELRIRSTLKQVGTKALVSPEAASARIASKQLALPSSFQGAIERVEELGDGRLIFHGWALSGTNSSEQFKFRVYCGGRRLKIEGHQRRRRPDVAKALGRDDTADQRFGFALVAPGQECLDRSQAVVLAFDKTGKAAVLFGSPGRQAL